MDRARARDRDLPLRTSCTAAIRCAPCSPSSSATPRARRIELTRLTRDELADLLEDILGGPPDAELVERLYARSEGNPLFTEELLAARLDGRGGLPTTLRDALMVRIERLSEPAQEVLRLLSAARVISHDVLADASGLGGAELRTRRARGRRSRT